MSAHFPGYVVVTLGHLTALRGGRRPCGRAVGRAMVGRTANLQCSLGAVNRLALYLWHYKLLMRSSLYYLHTAGRHFEKQEHVEYNLPIVCFDSLFLSGAVAGIRG